MEKRNLDRAVFHTKAVVNNSEKEIACEVENLSLKGMFAKCDNIFESGSEVTAEIFLSGTTSEMRVKLQGEVSRTEVNGFAVTFKEMELDSYEILKNIVNYSPKEGS